MDLVESDTRPCRVLHCSMIKVVYSNNIVRDRSVYELFVGFLKTCHTPRNWETSFTDLHQMRVPLHRPRPTELN